MRKLQDIVQAHLQDSCAGVEKLQLQLLHLSYSLLVAVSMNLKLISIMCNMGIQKRVSQVWSYN